MGEERCVVKVSCGASVGPSSFSLTQWLVWWPMSSASSRGSTWLMGTTSHQPTLCCVWGLNWRELTSNSWISPRPEFRLNWKVTWNASAWLSLLFQYLAHFSQDKGREKRDRSCLMATHPVKTCALRRSAMFFFQCLFLVMNSACLWV